MWTSEHSRAGTLTSARATAMASSPSSNGSPANRFRVTRETLTRRLPAQLRRPPSARQVLQPAGGTRAAGPATPRRLAPPAPPRRLQVRLPEPRGSPIITSNMTAPFGPATSGPTRPRAAARCASPPGSGDRRAHLAFQHEDDVRREVPVPAHHHARVVTGVDRQVLGVGREGQPLLPHLGHRAVRLLRWALIACQGTSGSSRWRRSPRGPRLSERGLAQPRPWVRLRRTGSFAKAKPAQTICGGAQTRPPGATP